MNKNTYYHHPIPFLSHLTGSVDHDVCPPCFSGLTGTSLSSLADTPFLPPLL